MSLKHIREYTNLLLWDVDRLLREVERMENEEIQSEQRKIKESVQENSGPDATD